MFDAPVRSALAGVEFPAIPAADGSQLLALQFQLSNSQWLPRELLLERQMAQLGHVLEHAREAVPYYRSVLDGLGLAVPRQPDMAFLRRLPILSRRILQERGGELRAARIPSGHGATAPVTTSGSTGTAVTVETTGLTRLLWHAFTLREHLWHDLDLSQKLSAIRWAAKDVGRPPRGERWEGWGPSTDLACRTGPSSMLNVVTPVDEQIEWLLREQPGYLVSFPSNLAALARRCLAQGIRFPWLARVKTFGETLSEAQRDLFREAWGCEAMDSYSCEEAGCLALQCPQAHHYHVQSENVLLEIVDDEGRTCEPGQTGRVLLTTLHNFATPLIRYELGDLAEEGGACACGRTLPVLARVRGRTRNRLAYPDGRSEFPYLGEHGQIRAITGVSVLGFQFIQHSVEEIELRLVCDRPFTAVEEQRVVELIQRNFGHPFRVRITLWQSIPRGAREKFEEFVSRVG